MANLSYAMHEHAAIRKPHTISATGIVGLSQYLSLNYEFTSLHYKAVWDFNIVQRLL